MSTPENVVDIVIDLETTGVEPGCRILSLGACAFSLSESPNYMDHFFYDTIAPGECKSLGLVDNPETVAWWEKQDAAARLEAFSGRSNLSVVLSGFSQFLFQFPKKRVWGNGVRFDNAILETAYQVSGLKVPWNFWEEACFRTARLMFPQIAAPAKPKVPHHALHDAIAEAEHLKLILEVIRDGLS